MSILQELIKEMAAGGAVGAGSIAVNMDTPSTKRKKKKLIKRKISENLYDKPNTTINDRPRTGVNDRLLTPQQLAAREAARTTLAPNKQTSNALARARAKLNPSIYSKILKYLGLNDNSDDNKLAAALTNAKQKLNPSIFSKILGYLGYKGSVNEAFDMEDVVSRLKDMEGRNTEDTVTYGVEDDAGNIMKVTVRRDAAAEFEERLSAELSNATQLNNEIGKQKSASMAELLFKLKDEFEIVDVEFPQIPANAIYNADKVKMSNDADAVGGNVDLDNIGQDQDSGELGGESGMDGPDALGGPGAGDAGLDGTGDETGELGVGSDVTGDELGGTPGEDEFGDDQSVSDFSEPESSGGVEGLLQGVLAMLKADAEAKKAQAEAEAEKARALQAEYTAKAASASVEQQAELLSMEQSIENQKKKEKDARRISDLAKYRVKQTNGMATESLEKKSDMINFILFEVENGETTRSVLAAMQNIKTSNMPPDQKMLAIKELQIRLQRVAKQMKAQRQQQQLQRQQGNMQQNPNQQVANTNQQGNTMNANTQAANQQVTGRLGSMQ